MAGYLGTKAVFLSTTAADVTGNAEVGGDLTVDTDTLYVDSTNNLVGLGTASPAHKAHLYNSGYTGLLIDSGRTLSSDNIGGVHFSTTGTEVAYIQTQVDGTIKFRNTSGLQERMRIKSNGFVGIGTSSPTSEIHLAYDDSTTYSTTLTDSGIRIENINSTLNTFSQLRLRAYNADSLIRSIYEGGNKASLVFLTDNEGATGDAGEVMRLTSDGNVLVNKTSAGVNTEPGFYISQAGNFGSTVDGGTSLYINRQTSDGDLIEFRKDGSQVGVIGISASNNLTIGSTSSSHAGITFGTNTVAPMNASNYTNAVDAYDLGNTSARWKNLYLSGGVYLGGTGSANYLDDYEEGTWTPTNAGDATGTLSSNGRYVKIGRQVTCHATISVTANFSSNEFGGLPFNPAHTDTLSSIHSAAVCVGGNVKMVSVNHASGNISTRDVNGATVNATSSQLIRFTIVYQTT